MPDPTKKKKKTAAPPQQPADSSAQISVDDYNSQLQSSTEQGTQDFSDVEGGQSSTAPHPVEGFWHRLVHGYSGEGSRTIEAAKGVARGAVNAGREAANTLNELNSTSEAAGSAIHQAVFGGKVTTNPLTILPSAPSTDAQVEHYLGKRSDDPLASFTESVSQFATGWAATGELKLLKGAGLAKMLARGALVDAAAFNPREAQLAEMIAKAPVPVVKQLGELLSVRGDDNQAVARLKRAAAGMVPVAAIETFVHSARLLRGLRAGEPEVVQQSAEALQNIVDGSHADGQPVQVKPVAGGYTLESGNGVTPTVPIPERRGETRPEPAELTPEQRTSRKQALLQEQQRLKTYADHPNNPEDAAIYMARHDRLGKEIEALDSPVFPSKTEATQQAETINNAIHERENVGKVDPEASTRVEQAAASVGTDNGSALAQAVQKPDLNVSIHNSVEDNLKLISDLSEKLATNIRRSVEASGKVSVEDAFKMARKTIGNLPEALAPDLLVKRLGDFEGQSAWNVTANMVLKDIGQKIARMSEVLDARPHDPVIAQEAADAVTNYFKLRDAIYGSESDAARTLRFVQEKGNELGKDVEYAAGKAKAAEAVTPEEAAKQTAPKSTKTEEALPEVAGQRKANREALLAADKEAVKQVARMFRMSSGAPRDMEAVLHGATVFKNTGVASKALEVFTNFLLSGPKTWVTVPLSGVTVTAFEPIVKMAAGLATANGALAREGADIMWANFKYLSDNVGIAAQSLRAGRSIINPAPQHIAIGGVTGQVIRTPSRILTALDELTRVTNYRSYVRAKSLRLGREQGLTGSALEARAESDVRGAFDPETGIATIPEALKYADVPTFSGPLGKETLGGKFHEFTNNAVEAKFIAPFIKASVNIFRYVWKSTPGLNLLNKQAREVMLAGGEEAAVLHARSVIAGSIYGVGLYNALAGNLTGRGPSDPDLRKLWLKNNQPYSIRVGSEWVSYRRADPLATPLGLIADLSTFIGELGHKDTSAADFAYATVASIVSNLGSKTYMQGITEFAQSWGAGDVNKVKQWIENFGANLTVPQLVSSFNDDPYYREVRTMGDAIMSRVPGWSEKLDPRYDIFGEPIMKSPWLMNRAVNALTLKPVGHSVEDDLLSLDKGLATLPQKPTEFGGFIDLADKTEYDNGKHVSPYSRIMQLVRKPEDGRPSLRDAMAELVQSDKWKDASDGVTLIPGGARWIMAAAVKQKYEQKALKQVLDEYPKLNQKYQGIQRLRGAAITGGEAGVADVEAMFGVKLQK